MARALRWDGMVVSKPVPDAPILPEDVRAVRDVAAERRGGRPFDIVVEGVTPKDSGAASERLASVAEAGATWWIESIWGDPDGIAGLRKRIADGPPRI
jgi:hypothetical protein